MRHPGAICRTTGELKALTTALPKIMGESSSQSATSTGEECAGVIRYPVRHLIGPRGTLLIERDKGIPLTVGAGPQTSSEK